MLLDTAIICDLCFYRLCNESCCIWQSTLSPSLTPEDCRGLLDYPCWFTLSTCQIFGYSATKPWILIAIGSTLRQQVVQVVCTFNAAAQAVAPALNHRRRAADAERKPPIPNAPCVPTNIFHAWNFGTYENENIWKIQDGFLYRRKTGS